MFNQKEKIMFNQKEYFQNWQKSKNRISVNLPIGTFARISNLGFRKYATFCKKAILYVIENIEKQDLDAKDFL